LRTVFHRDVHLRPIHVRARYQNTSVHSLQLAILTRRSRTKY
jgi:hypothetical protein